jgi:hypothetical protein
MNWKIASCPNRRLHSCVAARHAAREGKWQRYADQKRKRRLDQVVKRASNPFHVALLAGDKLPKCVAGQRLRHAPRFKHLGHHQKHDKPAAGIQRCQTFGRRHNH